MSDQTKDETKCGKVAATPDQAEILKETEKDASSPTADELSKISGGITKSDAY